MSVGQTIQEWGASLSRVATREGLEWLLRRYTRLNYAGNPPRRVVTDRVRMLYVPASVLPYHISGYTTRTHAIVRALRAAGTEVHVFTRPGYPWDRADRLREPAGFATLVDGVEYEHAREPSNRRPVLQFAIQAARPIAGVAKVRKVAVIHAASNHTNALPALMAARQLGIPFHYEMRGLWELTRISRMPTYERTQAFKQGLELEGLVARNADRLFVISEQLARYAQEHWSIPEDRIVLLPNCVDPECIVPADPRQVEPNTIGYAGSLICYEGLDTLVDAVDMLAKRGTDLRVNIIGDGEARGQLEAQVRRLRLSDRICFLGRVPPESAREILGRCALVCIPRKPFKVCEIVPPIKLVEAMALGKPVIVPDLAVFRDELGEHLGGWFFKAGDVADLARVIEHAFKDQCALARAGAQARAYATTQRNWRSHVANIVMHLPN